MNLKLILLFALLLATTLSALDYQASGGGLALSPKDQFIDYNSKSGLGFHFGTSTGSGYAMRFMGKKYGIQGTFGAYTLHDDNTYFSPAVYDYDEADDVFTLERDGRETAVNVGINIIFFVDHFDRGRLYIMAGGSYKYYQQNVVTMGYQRDPNLNYTFYQIPGSKHTRHDIENRWTAGVGPGFEFSLLKKLTVAFEIPFTFNWKHEIIMYVPQAGIYYYFK